MQIGERIRWIRKQRNMTIEALANEVGITRQTISRYETGAIEAIPSSKLDRIATALGVTCDYLKGLTIDSQCDSVRIDIQQQKEALKSAKDESERMDIELSIAILEESYSDLLFLQQFQNAPTADIEKKTKRHTIGSMVHEWHSAKNANLSMTIDSWLLLALKGMAADSNRSLADEIESALYDYVMSAIEDEVNKQDAAWNGESAIPTTPD